MAEQNTAQSNIKPQTTRATVGFALSLVAALAVLAQGIVRIFRGEAIAFLASDELRRRILVGLALQVVGIVAVIFAVLILIGAFLIYTPGKEVAGGILVLVFSVISIVTGGGWLIGLILGVAGGVLGLLRK